MNKKLNTAMSAVGVTLGIIFGVVFFCLILLAINPLMAKLTDMFVFTAFIIASAVCAAKHIKGSAFILAFWCIALAANLVLRFFNYTGGLYSKELYIALIKYALPAAEAAGAAFISLWFIRLLKKGKETDGNNS